MAAARHLITTLGGLVSHAAVVARGWGVPAVVGVKDLVVENLGIIASGRPIATGETVTVDGDLGVVWIGSHPGSNSEVAEVAVLRRWRDELSSATDPDPMTTSSKRRHRIVRASDWTEGYVHGRFARRRAWLRGRRRRISHREARISGRDTRTSWWTGSAHTRGIRAGHKTLRRRCSAARADDRTAHGRVRHRELGVQGTRDVMADARGGRRTPAERPQ